MCGVGEHPRFVALTLQSRHLVMGCGLPNPRGDPLDDVLCKDSQQGRALGQGDLAANIEVWSDRRDRARTAPAGDCCPKLSIDDGSACVT